MTMPFTFKTLLIPLSIFLLLNSSVSQAQTPPTWSANVAAIMYKSCTNCHHTGGVAPFSLMTYNQAANVKTSIRNAVQSGHMPPWPPDPKYSELAYARALSAADKKALIDWANADAPSGNLATAPTPPVYTDGPAISNPTWTQRIPKYTVSSNSDVYRCFPLRSNVSVDNFITGLECLPGNGTIVHHILIFADQSNKCFDLDAADPEPGYTSFGGVGSSSATLIGAWVPGSQPQIYPVGMGVRLKANANIIIQIHYAPSSAGKTDSTMLRLRTTTAPLREVYIQPILNHSTSLTNGPLVIPANTVKTFYASYTNNLLDATVISVAPHMHLLGKNIKSWANPPTGDTIKLIKIDNWDFHWQGSYLFKKAIKLPRLSRLQCEATYDNTINNVNNPNNPPKVVTLGEATTDEMMLIYFSFLAYQAGDENLVLETPTTDVEDLPLSKTTLSVFPNPTATDVTLRFNLDNDDALTIQLFDYKGVMLKNVVTQQRFAKGENQWLVPTQDLPNGVYFVKMSSEKTYGVQQFVKTQ
ncbi:MAG: T9SS type A sorting domain-containing protein [Saprospiraceae bacterium]|nr:T9SS type A sorting domain-containing protein [Saprospiraceae bacterium]